MRMSMPISKPVKNGSERDGPTNSHRFDFALSGVGASPALAQTGSDGENSGNSIKGISSPNKSDRRAVAMPPRPQLSQDIEVSGILAKRWVRQQNSSTANGLEGQGMTESADNQPEDTSSAAKSPNQPSHNEENHDNSTMTCSDKLQQFPTPHDSLGQGSTAKVDIARGSQAISGKKSTARAKADNSTKNTAFDRLSSHLPPSIQVNLTEESMDTTAQQSPVEMSVLAATHEGKVMLHRLQTLIKQAHSSTKSPRKAAKVIAEAVQRSATPVLASVLLNDPAKLTESKPLPVRPASAESPSKTKYVSDSISLSADRQGSELKKQQDGSQDISKGKDEEDNGGSSASSHTASFFAFVRVVLTTFSDRVVYFCGFDWLEKKGKDFEIRSFLKECASTTPFLNQQADKSDVLQFESRFESGNLCIAARIAPSDYSLFVCPDRSSKADGKGAFTQWFHFSVSNVRKDRTYRFTILNMYKSSSLFSNGQRPLMYSVSSRKWERIGENVSWRESSWERPDRRGTYYALSFDAKFHEDNDRCFIVYSFPYTYTDLQRSLTLLDKHPTRSKYVKRSLLCRSAAGNRVDLLTITAPKGEITSTTVPQVQRKSILLTSRVHPGESNASWVAHGVIEFLSGSTESAKRLREKYVFFVIPMLNPDGVIAGHYRCSITGLDLNRCWPKPNQMTSAEIYFAKLLLFRVVQSTETILFCDFHGHSRKKGAFVYGCKNSVGSLAHLRERILPQLIAQANPHFTYGNCDWAVQRAKLSTGRVVVWQEMGLTNSFTLETSLYGPEGAETPTHFETPHFAELGRSFAAALAESNAWYSDSRGRCLKSSVGNITPEWISTEHYKFPNGLPSSTVNHLSASAALNGNNMNLAPPASEENTTIDSPAAENFGKKFRPKSAMLRVRRPSTASSDPTLSPSVASPQATSTEDSSSENRRTLLVHVPVGDPTSDSQNSDAMNKALTQSSENKPDQQNAAPRPHGRRVEAAFEVFKAAIEALEGFLFGSGNQIETKTGNAETCKSPVEGDLDNESPAPFRVDVSEHTDPEQQDMMEWKQVGNIESKKLNVPESLRESGAITRIESHFAAHMIHHLNSVNANDDIALAVPSNDSVAEKSTSVIRSSPSVENSHDTADLEKQGAIHGSGRSFSDKRRQAIGWSRTQEAVQAMLRQLCEWSEKQGSWRPRVPIPTIRQSPNEKLEESNLQNGQSTTMDSSSAFPRDTDVESDHASARSVQAHGQEMPVSKTGIRQQQRSVPSLDLSAKRLGLQQQESDVSSGREEQIIRNGTSMYAVDHSSIIQAGMPHASSGATAKMLSTGQSPRSSPSSHGGLATNKDLTGASGSYRTSSAGSRSARQHSHRSAVPISVVTSVFSGNGSESSQQNLVTGSYMNGGQSYRRSVQAPGDQPPATISAQGSYSRFATTGSGSPAPPTRRPISDNSAAKEWKERREAFLSHHTHGSFDSKQQAYSRMAARTMGSNISSPNADDRNAVLRALAMASQSEQAHSQTEIFGVDSSQGSQYRPSASALASISSKAAASAPTTQRGNHNHFVSLSNGSSGADSQETASNSPLPARASVGSTTRRLYSSNGRLVSSSATGSSGSLNAQVQRGSRAGTSNDGGLGQAVKPNEAWYQQLIHSVDLANGSGAINLHDSGKVLPSLANGSHNLEGRKLASTQDRMMSSVQVPEHGQTPANWQRMKYQQMLAIEREVTGPQPSPRNVGNNKKSSSTAAQSPGQVVTPSPVGNSQSPYHISHRATKDLTMSPIPPASPRPNGRGLTPRSTVK